MCIIIIREFIPADITITAAAGFRTEVTVIRIAEATTTDGGIGTASNAPFSITRDEEGHQIRRIFRRLGSFGLALRFESVLELVRVFSSLDMNGHLTGKANEIARSGIGHNRN